MLTLTFFNLFFHSDLSIERPAATGSYYVVQVKTTIPQRWAISFGTTVFERVIICMRFPCLASSPLPFGPPGGPFLARLSAKLREGPHFGSVPALEC